MEAVTGLIGAGKSYYCNKLRKMEFRVLDCDEIVKELYVKDKALRNRLINELGLTKSNDTIDLNELADLIFTNPEAKHKLEQLVYPVLEGYLIAKQPEVVEVSNLIGSKFLLDLFDTITIVDAPEDVRLKRLIETRHMSEEDAKRRIEAQRLPEGIMWNDLFPGKNINFKFGA